MGESLTQQRRVKDEGLRIVNFSRRGRERTVPEVKPRLTTCQQTR